MSFMWEVNRVHPIPITMFAASLLWQYYLLEPTLCFNSSSSQKGISDNSTNYNGKG